MQDPADVAMMSLKSWPIWTYSWGLCVATCSVQDSLGTVAADQDKIWYWLVVELWQGNWRGMHGHLSQYFELKDWKQTGLIGSRGWWESSVEEDLVQTWQPEFVPLNPYEKQRHCDMFLWHKHLVERHRWAAKAHWPSSKASWVSSRSVRDLLSQSKEDRQHLRNRGHLRWPLASMSSTHVYTPIFGFSHEFSSQKL